VPIYLAESYLPKARQPALPQLLGDACRAAKTLTEDGTPVRHIRSTYLPDDEMCLHVFEAGSKEAVLALATRTGVAFDRVVEAIEDTVQLGERRRR
jgi:hypothetical protein